jgi:hypothetical protein
VPAPLLFDDALWLAAADALGLAPHVLRYEAFPPSSPLDHTPELVSARLLGPAARTGVSQARTALVGEVRGFRVIVHATSASRLGAIVAHVGLRAPLVLGLAWGHGRLRAHDVDHARVVLATRVGGASPEDLALRIGATDVRVDDRSVTTAWYGQPSRAADHVELVERALALAEALERARAEAPLSSAEDHWIRAATALADAEGLAVDRARLAVSGALDGFEVRAGLASRGGDASSASTIVTAARVAFPAPLGVGLSLRPQRLVDPVRSLFGMQDVTVGDAAFDRAFVVGTTAPDEVRRRLDAEGRAALVALREAGMDVVADDASITATGEGYVEPGGAIRRLAIAARALTARSAPSPYR